MIDGSNVWALVLWLIMGAGLVLYAVTAGADFGAGVWSLFARGARREEQRQAIHEAIAPIWEANHIWLIFVIVVMFSAFPRAFAVLGVALHIPIGLSLVGIVLRGAAFSFHAYGIQGDRARERWSTTFAAASALTPFFLGLVVAGVSSGEIRVNQGTVVSGWFAGWLSGFAGLVGLFTTVLFALLAACYLAAETSGALAEDFRRRALVLELCAGVLAALVFFAARGSAPQLFGGLAQSAWSWPVQGLTAAAAVGTLVALAKRRLRIARYAVAVQVGLVVVGWGLAMNRHFVLPDVSIANAGSHPQVLPALVLVLGLGTVVLAPALYYLYRVFKLGR